MHMAKAMSPSGQSSAVPCCSDPLTLVHKDNRKYRPSSGSSRFTAPSSGLLSLLATIAASSCTVDGSPTPPSFLCPCFDPETCIVTCDNPSDDLPPIAVQSSLAKRRTYYSVPYKYQPGSDGRWRRVDTFTLYGSTVCPTCQQSRTNSPVVHDEAPPSSSTYPTHSSTTASASQTIDILDTLPTGWKPSHRVYESRSALILSVSLVLAFGICSFIVGCVFRRKIARHKLQENDVEMKAQRHRAAPATDQGSAPKNEIRAKQKIWARATARWKANARYSARQRRGKRSVSATRSAHASSSYMQQSLDNLSTATASPSPSRSLSHRFSTGSIQERLTSAMASSAPDEIRAVNPGLSAYSVSSSPPPVSPPAYHQRVQVITADLERPEHALPSSPRPYDNIISTLPTSVNGTALHTHVSTDDKSVLARLAGLASAPPLDDQPVGVSSPEVSAPIWHEALNDIVETSANAAFDSNRCGTAPSDHQMEPYPPVLPIPPPPSKGKMAMHAFYDYSFENLVMSETETEPSAPPFEECLSPPWHGGIEVVPSAPPLAEGIGANGFSANVPHWEGCGSARTDLDDARSDEVGVNGETCINSHLTPMSSPGPFSNTGSDYTPRRVQGPVDSDGTLPFYSP